jgi:hypothetical protein
MKDRTAVVRRYLGAYQRDDRPALETTIADNFQFTSPQDDHIDRACYFQICWPEHMRTKAIDIEHIVMDGNAAYVTYMLERHDGRKVHNTERVTFEGDKINAIEVFFGASSSDT